ncbi:CaiB/BaiF CoA transferase family protein [Eubacterium sp.]|uniref:CaiB/BaiF CoA transferase family protein n=1 Tax=Eubacterium sp. TaxID=142586 RepID=UPI002FC59CF3
MSDNTGALSDLKVLDFTTLLPGPYATLMLADLGAQVLKIASGSRPDIVADYPPMVADTGISANQAWLGRNKRSMFLNLKAPEAVDMVKQLIMEYDIVIEQFRPGVMDRLGLGYGDLKAVNPRLIYCSLTGYGQDGPLSHRAGHDINYLARSGNMAYSGRETTGPVLTNMQIADLAVGSMNSVVGILAAVHHRTVTGEGQWVDVAMYDGLIPFNAMDGAAFLSSGERPTREGTRLNGGCLYDFYETADGEYMSVGALEPQFWAGFCACIGRPDWVEKTVWPEDVEAVKAEARAIFRTKTQKEWQAIFDPADVCVEPVLSLPDALLTDAHVQARRMVVDVPMPEHPEVRIKQLGCPIKLSACPVSYTEGGRALGAETQAVLKELGYSETEIEDFTAKGVFN